MTVDASPELQFELDDEPFPTALDAIGLRAGFHGLELPGIGEIPNQLEARNLVRRGGSLLRVFESGRLAIGASDQRHDPCGVLELGL